KMQSEIMVNIQEIINNTTGGDSMGFFLQLFNYIGTNEVQAEILSFDTGAGTGYEYIGQSIHKNYMLRWGEKFTGDQVKQYEYYRYYIIFGCIAVVQNWVKRGKKETPEEMAKIAFSLLPREKMYLKPDERY
ncbi:MAG: TetR family transcriptional regulator C-terminal domain-containing protein, partial [Lachnospiraceae bacterium]|nr:TetR family transcriptional regulator C-terminal domain-containing protein [Lachnospiraceae bacterium]